MTTVATDLDKIQANLHDSGVLWPRTELLRWYSDAYRDLLSRSRAFTRISLFDVPGRFAYSIAHDWEDRHTATTQWKFSIASYNAQRQGTYQWETEAMDGVTPTNSLVGITQQWERAYTGETDRHFRFGLKKDHERIKRLAWDNALLSPVSVRELDESDDAWMRRVGDPTWWTPGTGRSREFEIYEIKTDYNQGYEHQNYEQGIPRYITGARTYSMTVGSYYPTNAYGYTTSGDSDHLVNTTPAVLSGMGWRFTKAAADTANGFGTQIWEKQQLDGDTLTAGSTVGSYGWESEFGADEVSFGVGAIRGITSPDRQYLAIWSGTGQYQFIGGIRQFMSSDNALTAYETVLPDSDLMESDTPEMIPGRLQKYLRYYVLHRAFGRIGEGQNPELALHYLQRYMRGVVLLQKLADVAHKDRIYVKDPVAEVDMRPSRVRLPSTFERIF